MRVFEINGGTTGSTGKIMFEIAEAVKNNGGEVLCAAPITSGNLKEVSKQDFYKIGTYYSRLISTLFSKITGFQNCFSVVETLFLLKEIKQFRPDIILMHVLHGNYINLPLLFNFLKKYNGKIVWTMHDCWAMTGQCPHFTLANCDKWKTGCNNCPQITVYPSSFVDNTKRMWLIKRKLFSDINDLTIVCPSKWLMQLFEKSYMKNYKMQLIYNGVDLSVFHYRKSDFRRKHNILPGQIMLLGVAFGWGKRKGLDVFIELSKRLPSKYRIVLVGTDDNIDKILPNNILSIHRTHDQIELAEIYSAADIFINPTREEVLGMVNIEALACGTPAIVFNTGGCPEVIDEYSGICLKYNTVEEMEKEIISMQNKGKITKEKCVNRAKQFDKKECYYKYVKLFKE